MRDFWMSFVIALSTYAMIHQMIFEEKYEIRDRVETYQTKPEKDPLSYSLIRAIYEKPEDELLPLIDDYLGKGANINYQSNHGETALNVSFRRSKIKVFRELLKKGADPQHLNWDALHLAVVQDNLSAMKQRFTKKEDFLRLIPQGLSPFLLAVYIGDTEKADWLMDHTPEEGMKSDRDQSPAILIAARVDRLEMVQWLIDKGFNPAEATLYGNSALHEAAENGNAEIVELLLRAGADPLAKFNLSEDLRNRPNYKKTPYDDGYDTIITPMDEASNSDVAYLLYKAGASLQDVEWPIRREITGASRIPEQVIALSEFRKTRHPVYGKSNPEKTNHPFWIDQIRSGKTAYSALVSFEGENAPILQRPVWTHDRFGASITELADGRWVEIAGEHEDYYDSDFYIYNDVIVHDGTGGVDIYSYPKNIFPPTDFHSATLVGDTIYIIGSLGYSGKRKPGFTPVYKLDLKNFSISKIKTSGRNPGWIYSHQAIFNGNHIILQGGTIFKSGDVYEENNDRWILSLADMVWRQSQ